MGDVLICPRCGFRSGGADPMAWKLPDCRDPHCALDRVDGRPVGPALTEAEREEQYGCPRDDAERS